MSLVELGTRILMHMIAHSWTKPLPSINRIPICVLALFSLATPPCLATTIVDQLLPTHYSGNLPGDWFGTIAGADETSSYAVAQLFTTDQPWADVTAEVDLSQDPIQYPHPSTEVSQATFYIAADNHGSPGDPLATVQLQITNEISKGTLCLFRTSPCKAT